LVAAARCLLGHWDTVLALALLVATVLAIGLLSHERATPLDEALGRLGAPAALSGVLIAF